MKIPFFYCALLITTISGLCYVFEPTIIAKQYLNTLKKQTTEWANTLSQNQTKQHEKPTNNGYARYIEQMHRAAPGTNWRDIDHQTRLQLHRQHTQNQPALRDNNLFETLANGNLNGYWREIGSNNLAGRIVHADYDTSSNTIYAASISGSVWQSPADGSNWTVLNDKFRLSKIRTLHLIPNNAGTKRLLACSYEYGTAGGVYRTDDNGATWQQNTGLEDIANYGQVGSMVVANDANRTVYLLGDTWDYEDWGPITRLYRSTDKGETFAVVQTWRSDLDGNAKQFALWTQEDGGSGTVWLLNRNKLYTLNAASGLPELQATVAVSNWREYIILTGAENGTNTVLYAAYYDGTATDIYRRQGGAWTFRNSLSGGLFDRTSLAIGKSNTNNLYVGQVNATRSNDAGTFFTPVNDWGEYYSSPATKLHADIPYIGTFTRSNGTEFNLIGTDGGLYISNNNLQNVQNISMTGLRNSQVYGFLSHATQNNIVYVGTQDQGFQRSYTANTNLSEFDQVIAGDYHHPISGNGGQSVWAVYPGFVFYAPNAQTDPLFAYNQWDFVGSEFLWIPPLMAHPTNPQKAYIGGGGTSGAHIIELTYNAGSITHTQLPYNFGGSGYLGNSLSAIAISPINDQYRYAMTGTGKFFYSTNGGSTWTANTSFTGPEAFYLFGSAILPSAQQLGKVYIAGSGYSNAPVYVSTDNGATFTAMNNGLPNTLVSDLAANSDESNIFAATDVGPYMYVAAENMWYNIAGQCAPLHIYRDVEYLPAQNKIRFGADGRGLWEFSISTPPIAVKATALLQGCYNQTTGNMNTNLRNNNLLPNAQPFNNPPWNYYGSETANTLPTNAVDWVLLEVRNANAPYDLIAQKAAILLANGSIKDPDASNNEVQIAGLTAGNNYRLSIKTRNHLAILSSQAISLPNATAYNFKIAANVEGGSNQLAYMGSNIYALKTGDISANGVITVEDYNYFVQQISLINVFNSADCDLNGSVTTADFNYFQQNSSAIGVQAIRY